MSNDPRVGIADADATEGCAAFSSFCCDFGGGERERGDSRWERFYWGHSRSSTIPASHFAAIFGTIPR